MASRTHVGESAAPEKLTRPVLVVAAVICTCVVVSHMFGRSTISILLPAIRQDLVDSNTAAGVLGGSNFAGYIIGVVFVTVLAGRAGTDTAHARWLGYFGGSTFSACHCTIVLGLGYRGLARWVWRRWNLGYGARPSHSERARIAAGRGARGAHRDDGYCITPAKSGHHAVPQDR